jgi:NAD(P)-dependent dehydrogenase (short-subunit alcohol dehydrogenase family)
MGVTFLTGASSGIGRSLARRLAADGDAVAVVARRAELLESLVREIEAAGGRALAIPCDVTDAEAVKEAVGRTERLLGPIDRLVANAGGGAPTPVEGFRAEHVERVMALNLGGTLYCLEAVLPGMLARGSGHVVATSSLAALRGLPGAGAYCAAKAALNNLLESLSIDLEPRGVDVTLILPGFVRVKPGKAKRPKPFQLDLEDATRRMHRAIRRRRRRYAFPAPLVGVLGLARLLPAALWARLLRGRGPKPKSRG